MTGNGRSSGRALVVGEALLGGLVVGGLFSTPATPPTPLASGHLAWLGELATTAAAIACSRPGAGPPWRRELPVLGRPVTRTDG